MKNNLISICIANFNKGLFINQCLNSIKDFENIENIEIIIIDDCSTDNSKEIINDWIVKNQNIKVFFDENNKNSGPGITYNNAIKLANGEFITFMDSDDFFIKSTLENKRNKLIENRDLKIIYGNGCFFENNKFNGNIHSNIISLFKKFDYNVGLILNNIYCKVPLLSVSASLIRKDFLIKIGGFDEKCFSNDWILNIKIFQNLKNNNEFIIDEKIAFGYRIYDNNISKNYDKILTMLIQVVEKYCPLELRNLGYSNVYFTNSISNLSILKYKKAFKSFFKSIKYKFDFKKILAFGIGLFGSFVIKFLPKPILNRIKSIILKYFQ